MRPDSLYNTILLHEFYNSNFGQKGSEYMTNKKNSQCHPYGMKNKNHKLRFKIYKHVHAAKQSKGLIHQLDTVQVLLGL
jgi:hypothetical protein